MASVSSSRFRDIVMYITYIYLHYSICVNICSLPAKWEDPGPGGRKSTDCKSYLNDYTMTADQLPGALEGKLKM